MLGKVRRLFTILTLTMVLVACSSQKVQDEQVLVPSYEQSEANSQELLLDKPAQDLLASSASFSYPDGVVFTPTRLTDNELVLGEAYDSGQETNKYLASYDLKTEKLTKLKDLNKTSDLMTVGIYYADSDYLFFEEYDNANQSSYYYLWDFKAKAARLIHQTDDTPPIHYTQATRKDEVLYLNLYASSAIYQTYQYDIDNQQLTLIEEGNSSSPTIYNNQLYYITIDNQSLETAIVSKDLPSLETEQVYQTSGSSTYLTGLFSNGHQALYLQQEADKTSLYRSDLKGQAEVIYSADWIESLDYQGGFVSFVGDRRSKERVRSQYYLLDIDKNINYLYDDGPILLSQAGIFWIDFKKDEHAIEKGQVYTNENSVMRFYPFERR